MNYQRLLHDSLRNLIRFKLRSFFMSVGVILGVATLVVGSTLGSGAEQKITDQINQMFGPGTIFVASPELKAPDLEACLLYTSPSPRDATLSRMPSSA